MSWLFFAIMARFLWAGTNLIDQYVVRYAVGGSALVVMMIEHLMLLPTIIVIACIAGPSVRMEPATLVWLIGGVVINIVALFPYFLALKDDEAHSAIPLLELTPVILTLLAWVVFGDALNKTQLIGAAIVITGGFLFAWDFRHGHFKARTAILMTLSSVCFAIYQLALRYGAQHAPIWSVMLTVWVGYFVGGTLLFTSLPAQRRLLIESVRKSKGKILAIAFGEEILAATANVCLVTAFSHASKAGQVAALSATQPVFVLLISAALGYVLPRYFQGVAWDRDIKIKCLLLLVIASGIVLLKSSGTVE